MVIIDWQPRAGGAAQYDSLGLRDESGGIGAR
jgi:hypothetical protein